MLTTAVVTIDQLDQQLMGFPLHTFWAVVANVLPWLFTVGMVFLLYKFMPNTYVPWQLALGTAIPVGVLWEIMKRIFTSIVVSSTFFRSVYGSMAGFIILLIWVYMSSVLILFGAELGAAWQKELQKQKTALPVG